MTLSLLYPNQTLKVVLSHPWTKSTEFEIASLKHVGKHVLNIQFVPFESSASKTAKVKTRLTITRPVTTIATIRWSYGMHHDSLYSYAQLATRGLDHIMMVWHVHVGRLQFRRCHEASRPNPEGTTKASSPNTTGYSGIFIGGSRFSTRIRRSKSLSSNFFKKGWFCKNRNNNSACLNHL